MLDLVNRHAYGYVAVPVILSCREKGLFQLLQKEGPLTLAQMARRLRANDGYLQVALRMLESLQWVSCRNGAFTLEATSRCHREIPKKILTLYQFPIDSYLTDAMQRKRLRKWIDLSRNCWHASDPLLADLLDGVILLPLVFALRSHSLRDGRVYQNGDLFSKLSPLARREIFQLFEEKGWAVKKGERVFLNDAGRFVVDRIFDFRAIVSCKPMLQQIGELIFGDLNQVRVRDFSGRDRLVDREVNVANGNFQQESYLKDIDEIVLSIFNREPLEGQPKFIADLECGGGGLLKRIHEVIRNRSERGKVLDDYPIAMLPVAGDEGVLQIAANALEAANIPHKAIRADIGNPEQFLVDLKDQGIDDPENILYVCSFLDRDRYLTPSTNHNAIARRRRFDYTEVYADRNGRVIEPAKVVQSLVEHLRCVSMVLGKPGLINLEIHLAPPDASPTSFDQSDSPSLDALHAFMRQSRLEADVFLTTAAEAGLFPKSGFSKKYPNDSTFCRMSLNHFERREYTIRHADEEDLPALNQLEKECWPVGLQTPISILKKRLKRYPEGQLVLELENNTVGVIYSQRITQIEDLQTASSLSVDTLHDVKGHIVQLLSLNILPKFQHRNLGNHLLEFMLQRCNLLSGVDLVVGVTRCKAYHTQSDKSLKDYICERNAQGRLVDPILRFHELHGAQIGGLVPGYRPNDTNNEGDGVLVIYDVHRRVRNEALFCESIDREEVLSGYHPMCPVDIVAEIEGFLETAIKTCLGEHKGAAYAPMRPLMEMGLDSADLLTLKEQIGDRYQIGVEPSFFFQYNTVEKILSHLKKKMESTNTAPATELSETAMTPNSPIRKSQEHAHRKKEDLRSNREKDIAIVGMACRLPGGINSSIEFWHFLKSGNNAISRLPNGRWEWPENTDCLHQYPGIERGGFLASIDTFDSALFRISPKEAKLMDPQQRILLELAWEAFESAGLSLDDVAGSDMGIFVGASGSDYRLLLERYQINVDPQFGTGSSMALMANRISYFFDLVGPSIQLDTACSSSLVAIHEAVQAIRSRKCSQALVGGVNIICHPANSLAYYQAGMLSEDGQCKTFDKRANGYVRSEGAVALLLKPLKKAIIDGDLVHAVIKGTACNHGGLAGGLTVPNPVRQAELLGKAWMSADIHPDSVGFIETHGTGTALGDPVEIQGLKMAFSDATASGNCTKNSCGLGSVKSNIGHLEAAAGIAGLLKTILCLKNQELVASVNFKELNPQISLSESPFYILDQHKAWNLPSGHSLRTAGVSSFGSGGTNAHVILQEFPSQRDGSVSTNPSAPSCFTLSASNEEGLRVYAQRLLAFLIR